MNSIAERAGSLGLFVTANMLADAKLDSSKPPRDARIAEQPAADVKRILGQMARRGSDPVLVTALWGLLANRPLERALVAIDVLGQAIWSTRDSIYAELRAAAASLGDARTPGEIGIDLNAHSARDLIARYPQPELQARPTIDLVALAYDQSLAVLDELLRRGDDLLTKDAVRESIHAFGRLASLARLPTLASVYLDWLMRGLEWRAAAPDLCEALFDAQMAHKIPGTAIQPGDVPEDEARDVGEYLMYRAHLGVGDSDTANALLRRNLTQRPRWIAPPGLRVDVVRAHLGVLYGVSDVQLARVEAACADDRLWRYGAKVRAIVAAKRSPARAVDLFHAYIASFGNDYEMTNLVASLLPDSLKRNVAVILCREALHLAHEPAPWKVLGELAGFAEPISDEVDARVRSQLA